MPYVVFVASDIFGQKVNLELEFAFAPTLAELSQSIEQAFTAEQQVRRPGSAPYQVSKLQVVDEATDDWVDVVAANQLRNFCQVYSFQPHSTRYTEAQGHIPAAVKPRTAARVPSVHPSAPGSVRGPSGGAGPYDPADYGAPPQPAIHSKTLPEQASHDEKVRIVFEEIDTNRDGVIQSDELRKAFQLCELGFTHETQDDLFAKADCDRDGVVTFAEWQRWAELYPTTLECLYFRLKLNYERQAADAAIEAVRAQRSRLEDQEREAMRQQDQASRDEDDAQRRIRESDEAIEDTQQRMRAADDAIRDQQGAAESLRQTLGDRQRALEHEREQERQAQLRAQDSARDLDAATRRQRTAQQAAIAAEQAEERARKALEDAQREKERQRQLAEEAEQDAARARARHDEIMGQVPQQLESAQRAVQEAERDLRDHDRKTRDLARSLQDAARSLEDAQRRRADDDAMLQQARQQKEPARRALDDARAAIEDHDRRGDQMRTDADRDAARARELFPKENALCEQEVRLREQREMLEQKEGALREAHNTFFSEAGRAPSPGRLRHQQSAHRPAFASPGSHDMSLGYASQGGTPGAGSGYGTPPKRGSVW
eukprot:TRINITY_DN64971_c0_g1_i1.p1 TRINITY_DN64971_c0_g1~~TRINITY_DN64971_c0_g1_i1.p1  ORF type:complete len:631 (+),score=222.70 TRINITY_DN64971_c0_g1_i1:88-1893(+)